MRSDLIVVGGGATGASLARAARGLSVALVSSGRPPATPRTADSYDARVYALSPGSVAFLREIKAWDAIPPERVAPVYAMRVHGDATGSMLEFDAYRAGVPELAWIVEDRELQSALWRALATQDRLEILAPANCAEIRLGEAPGVTLEDGRHLEADLIVGADGADSFVRRAAGIACAVSPYGQTAVVANFYCSRPHENVAIQWFQGGAVLAFLPLPADRISMVWSLPSEAAARIAGLDAVALAAEVTQASGNVLGALECLAGPVSFPLRRQTADRMVCPHVALAGDAAHVIHPLAGQGLNLGLQDARALGAVLAAREPVRSPGDVRLLRRYERERSEAILAMRTGVHGLHSLFAAGGAFSRRLRNDGLNLTDRLPVLKNILVQHALR